MASIAVEKLTMGRGTYRIVAYDPGEQTVLGALKIRFEMMNDGRLIDIILSKQELDLIAEWR